uniref:Uncharacterized protein n=1 Tax=Eutreptiella gymnastica TaxID=73025 RepID=A0A7S4CVM3_9EUGL
MQSTSLRLLHLGIQRCPMSNRRLPMSEQRDAGHVVGARRRRNVRRGVGPKSIQPQRVLRRHTGPTPSSVQRGPWPTTDCSKYKVAEAGQGRQLPRNFRQIARQRWQTSKEQRVV